MAFYSKYVFQKIEFYLRTIEYNKCCNSIFKVTSLGVFSKRYKNNRLNIGIWTPSLMKLLINEGFVDYYFVLLLMFVFKQKFDYIKGKKIL